MATEQDLTPNDEGPSLRDTLDAAFQEHATDEVDAAAAPAPAASDESRQRDERGRFASKAEEALAAKTPAAATEKPQAPVLQGQQGQGGQVPPAPAPGDFKAPASWKPQARELWASLPQEAKAEVVRREHEAQQVLQQAAESRQFMGAFERVVQPYEMFIRAENSTPLQAVQNLMQTAAQLRMGSAQDKANIVAGVIKQYGIDLGTLDTILAGQTPQGGQQQPQQFRDPRMDQLLAYQQQMLAQQNQRQEQEMRQSLRSFAETHEFYADVAGVMADLVEVRARAGQPVDLEKIYAQACKMDENISNVLNGRATAQRQGGNSQAVLRAKRAAVSVKGDQIPDAGTTVPKDDSIRAAIEAAIEQQRS